MNNFTAENWYDVGITYDDPNKITECLHKAVKLDPLHATAWHRLGCLYSNKGDDKTAEFCNIKAVDAYKAQLERFKREMDSCEWKKKNKPIQSFRQGYDVLADIDQIIDDNLENLGYVYGNMEDHENAIKCYEKILDKYPTWLKIIEFRGMEFFEIKKYIEAIDDLRFVVEEFSNKYQSLYTIAKAYEAIDDIDRAIYYYRKTIRACDEFPEKAKALLIKSKVHFELDEFKDSICTLEKLIQIDSENPELWMRQGDAYFALHKEKEAKYCYAKNRKLSRKKIGVKK
ncbi:MAG: tetratricopeptide repeat protein [Nitrosarchaeum sp.]